MAKSARPYVVLTMAMSVDGKIAPAHGPNGRVAGPADLARLIRLRATADALVVGAGTVRAIDPPMGIPAVRLQAQRTRRGQAPEPMVVVLSAAGRVNFASRAFALRSGRARALLVTAGKLSKLAQTQAVAAGQLQHVRCGRAGVVDVAQLLAALRAAGIGRVLVEGGADTAWHFLKAGAVDEIHLSIAPRVLGGIAAPSLVGGRGFALEQAPAWRLQAVQRRGHELWLVYTARAGGGLPAGERRRPTPSSVRSRG